MTAKTQIENIRKIAKTDEILKLLRSLENNKEKAGVDGSRGTGFVSTPYQPCQTLYTSEDGVYSFEGLLNGTEGPKLTDGDYNQCSQVNTINGIYEIGSDPQLNIVLKPDGLYLQDDVSYLYTTSLVLQNYRGNPEDYDKNTKWGFLDLEELAAKNVSLGIAPGYVVQSTTITKYNITDEQINGANYSKDYPTYLATYVIETTDNGTIVYNSFLAGIPSNYDFTKNTLSPGSNNPPYVEIPTTPLGGADYVAMLQLSPGAVPNFVGNTFQLALNQIDGLWRPKPDDLLAPLKYKNGVSVVAFNFGVDIVKRGYIHPAKDGGFMIYEVINNEAYGNVYVYRRERTLAAIIPASQIQAYMP